MNWRFPTLVLAAVAYGEVDGRLLAQVPEDQSARLDTSIELNKQVFLAGEEVEITVKLRNATSVSLTAPAPFHPQFCGAVYLVPWDPVTQAPSVNRPVSEMPGACLITESTPFETFPSGHERTVRWRTSDPESRRPAWAGPLAVPRVPGQYAIVWKYSGDFVRLRIVGGGELEAVAEARNPVDFVVPPNPESADPGGSYPVYQRAIAIRRDSISIVGVVLGPKGPFSGDFYRRAVVGPYISDRVSACAPFRIVATSTLPITEIQVTVDTLNNTTIIYRDAGGTQRRIDLDPDYNPR